MIMIYSNIKDNTTLIDMQETDQRLFIDTTT